MKSLNGPVLDSPRLVVDAFIVRDETDLVDLRAKYLSGVVDLHIACESGVSFSGEPKELVFSALKQNGRLPDNLLVWQIDVPQQVKESGSTTEIQDYIRLSFSKRLGKEFEDCVIFFSDVDEIPSASQVASARECMARGDFCSVPMRMFYRRANWELLLRESLWRSPKVFFGEPPTVNLRSHPGHYDVPGAPGCHFSFLNMAPAQLRKKFEAYGHQEYNREGIWSSDLLSYCDLFGLDHLGRVDRKGSGLLKFLESSELPEVGQFLVAQQASSLGGRFSGSFLTRALRAQVVWRIVQKQEKSFSSIRPSSHFSPSNVMGLLRNRLKYQQKLSLRQFVRISRKVKRYANRFLKPLGEQVYGQRKPSQE